MASAEVFEARWSSASRKPPIAVVEGSRELRRAAPAAPGLSQDAVGHGWRESLADRVSQSCAGIALTTGGLDSLWAPCISAGPLHWRPAPRGLHLRRDWGGAFSSDGPRSPLSGSS